MAHHSLARVEPVGREVSRESPDRTRVTAPTSYVRPTIGRIVLYRGKVGLHAMRAALITCTVDTLEPQGVADGLIPPLTDQDHVHLHVFTPSNMGFFIEYNVPKAAGDEIAPGEWAWPPRV